MLLIKPKAKYFIDLFGGGGAMSFAALQKGLEVIYNEKQTDLVNFIRFIFDCIKEPKSEYGIFPAEYYNFITRKEFIELREQEGNYAQFARICYSFGNDQRSYLFNPKIEKHKHLGHNIVVHKCTQSLKEFNKLFNTDLTFSEKQNWNDRRLDFRSYLTSRNKRLELERLEQLERLQRLEQLQQNITFYNLDYKDVPILTPIEETIVYLDPPYRGTAKYIEGICHKELDEYFANLPYLAFMSEYNAPFDIIYRKKTASNMATNKPKQVCESLYVNKNTCKIT